MPLFYKQTGSLFAGPGPRFYKEELSKWKGKRKNQQGQLRSKRKRRLSKVKTVDGDSAESSGENVRRKSQEMAALDLGCPGEAKVGSAERRFVWALNCIVKTPKRRKTGSILETHSRGYEWLLACFG